MNRLHAFFKFRREVKLTDEVLKYLGRRYASNSRQGFTNRAGEDLEIIRFVNALRKEKR